jgi:hypothetical protein
MLFTNSAGKWGALITVCLLVLAIAAGLLYVDPEAIKNQPTTAGAGCAESASTGWEWVVITALAGVIIGMTVGIALVRPPLTS